MEAAAAAAVVPQDHRPLTGCRVLKAPLSRLWYALIRTWIEVRLSPFRQFHCADIENGL